MKGRLFLLLLPPLMLGGLAYLASTKLWLALTVAVLAFLEIALLLLPMMRRFQEKERKRHECYRFVHAFLVTLSVCDSLQKAYEAGERTVEGRLKEICDGLTKFTPKERVDYLASYFSLPIYGVFLSLLDLYLERGGDVLKISSSLLEELTRIEESGQLLLNRKRRNLVQYVLMWLMSLGIMSFIRYGLSSFFAYLVASKAYLIAILAYFLFLLASFFAYGVSYVGPGLLGKRKEGRV